MDRDELVRAVDLARTGDWHAAHTIVQDHDSDRLACWIHAVLHKQEGDADNARYWYARADQFYESYGDPDAELSAIRAVLTY